jgi:acyl dehydratase
MTTNDTQPRLVPGETLEPFVRQTGFPAWNRFAAVNDEFVPIHMDDDAGREAGYDGAFGMGNLQFAYLLNLLRNWAGDSARIVRVNCQFRNPDVKGTTVTAHGVDDTVREEDGVRYADLTVWTEDQHGNKLAPGSATVAFDL